MTAPALVRFVILFASGYSGSAVLGQGLKSDQLAVPTFEVANIHLSPPNVEEVFRLLPGGRLEIQGLTLRQLVGFAWAAKEEGLVNGGPAWTDSPKFSLIAKFVVTESESEEKDTLRLRLQSLLLERFQLAIHFAEKVRPVYALLMGPAPLQLSESHENTEEDSGCRMKTISSDAVYVCHKLTIAGLASRLQDVAPAYLDHPVIDLTGLTRKYDFTLSWTPRALLLGQIDLERGGEQNAQISSQFTGNGLTIFEAVKKQLGLELVLRKYPVKAILIDSVQMPSPN